MKKLLLLLAVVVAFTCTQAMAQYGSSSSSGQSSTMDQSAGKKAKKDSTLTGCLSKEPGASGNYTLTNGKFKKGVEVMPTDKVQGHGGHTVQLTGQWSSDKKSFEVASMKHISPTCTMGGDTGKASKGKMDMAPKK